MFNFRGGIIVKENKKEVLHLSEAECLKLEKELEMLTETLVNLRNHRKENHSEAEWYIVVDGDTSVEEKLVIAEIEKVRRLLARAVKVQNKEDLLNTVNLGDLVELNLIFGEDDQERMLVRLGTVRKNNSQDDVETISVESPLGSAIYKQEVGSVVPYPVNGNMYSAEILSIINKEVKEADVKKTK